MAARSVKGNNNEDLVARESNGGLIEFTSSLQAEF